MENNDKYIKYERLVKSIADKYKNKGIPLNDLITFGYEGLSKALKDGDESSPTFIAYATRCIRGAIKDEFGHLNTLKKNTYSQIKNMEKVEDKLTQELKRVPTAKELAEKMGKKVKKIIELKELSQSNISLDSEFETDSNVNYYNLIADQSITPIENITKHDYENKLKIKEEVFLKKLNPIEKKVYKSVKKEKKSFTDVAKQLNVGRSRIKTIYDKVDKKLQDFKNSEEYININNGKNNNLLMEIVKKSNESIDASALGEKFLKYENYDNLQEIDFKELKERYDKECKTTNEKPTFETYFDEICSEIGVNESTFARATGLQPDQFKAYKTPGHIPTLKAIVAFGIYFKLSYKTINTLLEYGGYRFKVNDKTHTAYSYLLEELKGYPIAYCNKVLEFLGVEEKDFLHKYPKRGRKKKKNKEEK